MKIKELTFLLLLAIGIMSCGKDDPCKAGNNGNITLVAFGKHHGKLVQPTSVHVKFNSLEYPGLPPEAFDLNLEAEITEDHIHIPNLSCGDYYIYMTGYDPDVMEIVKGGIPYSIPEKSEGEIDVDIPITE